MVPITSAVAIAGIQPLDDQLEIIVSEVIEGLMDLLGVLHRAQNDAAILILQNISSILAPLLKRAADEKRLHAFIRSEFEVVRLLAAPNGSPEE